MLELFSLRVDEEPRARPELLHRVGEAILRQLHPDLRPGHHLNLTAHSGGSTRTPSLLIARTPPATLLTL